MMELNHNHTLVIVNCVLVVSRSGLGASEKFFF